MATDQDLVGLVVRVKADLADYVLQLAKMEQATKDSADNVGKSFDNIGSSMAKAGAAMGAFAGTAIMSAANWGTAIDKLSHQTGMSSEEVSQFLVVAKRVGIDTDTAGMMFAKFAKSINSASVEMAKANADGKTSTDVFTKLGVATVLANGQMRPMGDILADVKTKLSGMQDGWQKTAIEMELFGKTGYQLNGLLNMSSEAMQAVIEKAQAMGMILNNDQSGAWRKFKEDLEAAKGTLTAVGIVIGNELMPQVTNALDEVTSLTKAFVALDPSTRENIISIVTLGTEVGIASVVISKTLGVIGQVTEFLGIMRLATVAAAGPWLTLAYAISQATIKLAENQAQVNAQPARDEISSWTGHDAPDQAPYTPNFGRSPRRVQSERKDEGLDQPPPPDNTFIGGNGETGSSKKETELQLYLKQLRDAEEVLKDQVSLGEINKEQEKEALEAQLTGLEAVTAGQNEQMDKERAIYDLKSRMRQIEQDEINTAKAKSDRDFSAQTITETEYFEQRKKEIQDEINLTAEGTAERYNKEKELQDLINSNNEKQYQRTLDQIAATQNLENARLKTQQEEVRHNDAMASISIGQYTIPEDLQKQAREAEALANIQYQNALKTSNDMITVYQQGGQKDTDNLKKELENQKVLTQNHDNEILNIDNQLQEKEAELQQKNVDAWNETISDLITGQQTGQQIMLKQWDDFVNKVIAKLLSIKSTSNIFESVLGPLFGLGTTSGGTTGYGSAPAGVSGPSFQNGGFYSTPQISGQKAGGGPVSAGKLYQVNELGVEAFQPSVNGYMLTANETAQAANNGSNAPVINIENNTGVQADATATTSFDKQLETFVINVTLNKARRDSSYRQAFGSVK